MNRELVKNACFGLFVLTMFLFFKSAVEELIWATAVVLDAMKLDWNASQSATYTSNLYSNLSLAFFVLAMIFLIGWLYYRRKNKS